jgi:formylglycine-generating enzyme required for sulfatase activity
MEDKELKKQLKGLFSELADSLKPVDAALAPLLLDDELPEYRLAGLFSDLDEPGPVAGSQAMIEAPPSAIIIEANLARPEAPVKEKVQKRQRLEPDQESQTGLVSRIVETVPAPIEDDIVRLLKSNQVADRCRAVQNLGQLQSEWSIDPLLYAVTDRDQEVARLALEALLPLHLAVVERIMALAQQEATPLQRGGTAYLSYVLVQPVVYIPPGPFIMGSDPIVDELADVNERPQHTVTLPGYWLGRYPVTAKLFRSFLAESDYRPRRGDRSYGEGNYPVVDVTWDDALAYCRWLEKYTMISVTLPSEAEWEKAARGADGRCYPWGNRPPTEELCNFHHSTPVGHYSPQGDSPYGCADMAGNVWEWTRSAYKSYPYRPTDGREKLEQEATRVVRGLTFNNQEWMTRCAFRHHLAQVLHLNTLGFRIAVSPRLRQLQH